MPFGNDYWIRPQEAFNLLPGPEGERSAQALVMPAQARIQGGFNAWAPASPSGCAALSAVATKRGLPCWTDDRPQGSIQRCFPSTTLLVNSPHGLGRKTAPIPY